MGGVPVRFTPLYGVHGGQPLCYLLELGDFIILLDCGWNDRYDPALLRPLHDVLDHIDLGEAAGGLHASHNFGRARGGCWPRSVDRHAFDGGVTWNWRRAAASGIFRLL